MARPKKQYRSMLAGTTRPTDPVSDREAAWRLVRLLARLAWRWRRRLAAFGFYTLARAACLGLSVYFLHSTLSRLLDAGNSASFVATALGLLACQLLAAFCQYRGEEAQRSFLEAIELDGFEWALRPMVRLPADFFRTRPIMKIVLYLERVHLSVRLFFMAATTFANRGLVIAGIVAGVISQTPWLGLSGLLTLAVVAIWVISQLGRLRRLAKAEFNQDIGFVDRILAIFSSLRDLHNYGLCEQALRQFEESCTLLAARIVRVVRVKEGAGVRLQVLGILLLTALVAGMMWLGVSAASAVTCFAALGMLLEPVSEIVRSAATVQTRIAKLGDLFYLIDQLEARGLEGGSKLFEGPIESLEMNGVGYAVSDTPILENVCFTARRGEIVGIVGRSGAGKTTLLNLALGLIEPTSGSVLINGHDGRSFSLDELWKNCAYQVQVPCQVGDSIEEDVRMVRPDATEEEWRSAVMQVGIPVDLAQQPIPVATWDGNGSQSVWYTRSLQQRVEWARIVLRRAQIVALDEPTSLSDHVNEERFVRLLQHGRDSRITLLVSHRPATLAICDRLIVLDEGKVVAQGDRTDILSRWLPNIEEKRERAS